VSQKKPTRKRRAFDSKFKADAVRLTRAGDRSLKQVAAELDVTEVMLRRWVEQAGTNEGSDDGGDEGTRDRMIAGAAQLLASRGLQGTSFTEVLASTGAPRGSVYHHFPGGKDQLVKAALDLVSAQMDAVIEPKAGESAVTITETFLHVWRTILARSQFRSGCAIAAVTVAADEGELQDYVAAIFRAWRGRMAELLTEGGLRPGDASGFAATLVAACEGAVILSRGEQSMEPFDLVSTQMLELVRRFAGAR
jgi:TetR/AcrR family transcriptional regulator, lmrAB and yxaGH operons repressor